MKRYTAEDCQRAVERFYKKHGRPPRTDEMGSKNQLPSGATFRKVMGTTPEKYLVEKYPEVKSNRRAARKKSQGTRKDKKVIVAEYRKFLKEHGRLPSLEDCRDQKLPYPVTFKNATGKTPGAYFGNSRSVTPEKVRDRVARFAAENGRLPVAADFRSANGLPTYATFKKATGKGLREYLNEEFPDFRETASPVRKTAGGLEPALPELMKRLGVSVEELASQTGIDPKQLEQLIAKEPSREYRRLYAVARALKVPMEILFREEKEI